jgi:hypothetical protein
MPSPRLIAIITALIMIAPVTRAGAQYTLAQLQELDALIQSQDCEALWLFVQANPALVEGNDPLARELSMFVEGASRGQIDCFSVQSAAVDDDGSSLPY